MKSTYFSYVCLVSMALSLFVPFLAATAPAGGGGAKEVLQMYRTQPVEYTDAEKDKALGKSVPAAATPAAASGAGGAPSKNVLRSIAFLKTDKVPTFQVIVNKVKAAFEDKTNNENDFCRAYNESVKYTGKVQMFFDPKDDAVAITDIKTFLKDNFGGIYGLDFSGNDSSFDDAVKNVFKTDGLVFDNVTITDSSQTNLENFKAHIRKTPSALISADEKDTNLVALKAAIEDYNKVSSQPTTADAKAKLEKVKEAWLNQLKGKATLGNKLMLIVIIVVLVFVVLIVAVIAYLYWKKRADKKKEGQV